MIFSSLLSSLALAGAIGRGNLRGTGENAFTVNTTFGTSSVVETRDEHSQMLYQERDVPSIFPNNDTGGVEHNDQDAVLRMLKPKKQQQQGKTKKRNGASLLQDWALCSISSQCGNGCCSNAYSTDGQLRCTPLNGGFRADLCLATMNVPLATSLPVPAPPTNPPAPATSPPVPATSPPVPAPSTYLPAPETMNPLSTQYGLQMDCYQDDASRFNMCLDLGSKTGSYQPWMDGAVAARNRWQNVILADTFPKVDSREVAPFVQGIAGAIATSLPPFIDDLYIAIMEADFAQAGILAQGGPTFIKFNSAGRVLPMSGRILLGSAYIQDMQARNALYNLFTHEMGHVLGFGTLFRMNGLHSGSESDSKYNGQFAQEEWRQMGCSLGIPVETDRGRGTAGVHWDEECMDKEIMTGVDDDQQFLSRMTIAAMRDLGYTVNMTAADPFGLDQLSRTQCAAYCPEATGASSLEAGSSTLATGSSTLGSSIAADTEERGAILSVAADVLQENRANAPLTVPEGYMYVGGDIVTVYTEGSDGHIKATTVTWDEVQDYIKTGVVV